MHVLAGGQEQQSSREGLGSGTWGHKGRTAAGAKINGLESSYGKQMAQFCGCLQQEPQSLLQGMTRNKGGSDVLKDLEVLNY